MASIQDSNLLSEFKSLPNWVLWRSEQRDGKPTKIPYTVRGVRASSTDPGTWATYEDAQRTLASGGANYEGAGFALSHGYVLIDLDDCRNPETGEITDKARAIVERVDSYTEISPSAAGLHIYVHDPNARTVAKKEDGIEIYAGRRYSCVTQLHLHGTPTKVRNADLSDLIRDVEAGRLQTKADRSSRRI